MEALLNKIQSIQKNLDINKIIFDLLSDAKFQEWIINLVRLDQLKKEGVSDENVIIGYYSPYTEAINPQKKTGTHYTLLDTGAFYSSFKIIVKSDSFIIYANSDKQDEQTGEWVDLVEVFKEKGNITGLTDDNTQRLIDSLGEKISKKLWNIMTA